RQDLPRGWQSSYGLAGKSGGVTLPLTGTSLAQSQVEIAKMIIAVLGAFLEQIARGEIEFTFPFWFESGDGLGGTHQDQREFWRVEVKKPLIEHRAGSHGRFGRRLLCAGQPGENQAGKKE